MRRADFFIAAGISVLLEATVLNGLRVFGVQPQIALVCVVLASLYLDSAAALGLAIFAGLLKDIFSPCQLGMNTLFFVFCAWAVRKLSRKISLETNYLVLGLICAVVVLRGIIFSGTAPVGICLRIIILETAYTAAVFPLAIRLMHG
jgi:rod shape-determining protein MreD